MTVFEYKIVPSPRRATKAKGVKHAEDRFAHTVEQVLNDLAAEGWEYQRSDLLPQDERSGLTGTATHWRNVLVFRRPVSETLTEAPDADIKEPAPLATPEPENAPDLPPEPEFPTAPPGEEEVSQDPPLTRPE